MCSDYISCRYRSKQPMKGSIDERNRTNARTTIENRKREPIIRPVPPSSLRNKSDSVSKKKSEQKFGPSASPSLYRKTASKPLSTPSSKTDQKDRPVLRFKKTNETPNLDDSLSRKTVKKPDSITNDTSQINDRESEET